MGAQAWTPEEVEEYVVGRLDAGYVEGVAVDVAVALDNGESCEVAFQPGDGSFYGLVFVPLVGLRAARPRVATVGLGPEPVEWETHAVRELRYERGAALVVSVEQPGVLPVQFVSGINLHWSAPLEAFKITEGSAHAVAHLLARIGAHLRGDA